MIYLIIFAIIIFVMFALNPELIMLVISMVIIIPISAIIDSKRKDKRNATYSAQYGKKMKLMTVYGNTEKEEIIRNEDGSVSGEIWFFAKESQIVTHSYKPAEAVYRGVSIGGIHVGNTTVTPGGMVSKNNCTSKGYVEASKRSKNYRVDRVELSPEICSIYASDPLFQKYVRNGQILCNNGTDYTDAELTACSRLDSYRQAEYATLLVDRKCIGYDACKEIVTLLNRIQDGMNPEEMRLQEKKRVKLRASIFLGLILLIGSIFFALGPYLLEETIVRDLGRNQTYMNLNPTFYNGESVSLTIDTFEVDYDEYRPRFNFYIHSDYSGCTEYMDIETLTWTKMKLISYEYDYDSPFSGPFILKYKWNDGQFIATKLLDSEGNVLWTRKVVAK